MKYFLLLIFFTSSLWAAEEKPRKVYLKEGSNLIKKSGEKVETTKGIYVYVLPTSASHETFYVYNKKGKTDWRVGSLDITEIENETRILPDVDANIVYPAPQTFQSANKYALIDTNFNLHLESFSTSPFSAIYESTTSSVIAPRYEIRTLYVSDLPINIGFSFNYQTTTYKTAQDSDLTFTILSFGPQLERIVYTEELLTISVVGGAEFAPIYQAISGEYKEKYNALLFDIGVEGVWDTRFGKWSLGTHFRHHDLTLSETNRPNINLSPETITMNTIGVMAGYKYEWDL